MYGLKRDDPTIGDHRRIANTAGELRFPQRRRLPEPKYDFLAVEKLGYIEPPRAKRPAHPRYADHEARARSYASLSRPMSQSAEELAAAGFFYAGKDDRTLCYHCGGGLKDWEPRDDPWRQHAKWFPKCGYLLTVKGRNYVDSVLGRGNATSASTTPSQLIARESPKEVVAERSRVSGESRLAADGSKPVEDARLCKICYNDEVGVVFLPCGHLMACLKCAPNLKACAACRAPIAMIVRTFFT